MKKAQDEYDYCFFCEKDTGEALVYSSHLKQFVHKSCVREYANREGSCGALEAEVRATARIIADELGI